MKSSLMHSVQRFQVFWSRWVGASVNRKMFQSVAIVGLMTIFVKAIAFGKDVIVAHQFGTSDDMDAFFISLVLPSFVASVIGGALNTALVPTYIQVREQDGQEHASRLFSNCIVLSGGILLTFFVVLILTASWTLPLLGQSFNADKIVLTRQLFFILSTMSLFWGLTAVLRGTLNANNTYALPAWTPALVSLGMIVALLGGGSLWGVYTLAIGMVAGHALETGVLIWKLKQQGIPILPRWYGLDKPTRQVLHQFAPMVASSFLIGNAPVVDQSMATMAGSGAVSTFNYGTKIITMMLGIGSLALSTAALPHFSQMIAVKDWVGLRHTLKTYTRLIFGVTVPLMIGIMIFSEQIIGVLFGRGAFTADDVYQAAQVQILFALQIPFFVLAIFLVRLVSALRHNHFLTWGSGINLFFNIALNYLFVHLFGLKGIALSTSVVYGISWLYLSLVSQHLLRAYETAE